MAVLVVVHPAVRVGGEEAGTVVARLFPGAAIVEPARLADGLADLAPGDPVVAAGGDGTVGVVARAVAGTRHPLAIVPLGTFNNFSRALGIPGDPERAAALTREGAVVPVSLGRVNGHVFLEAAALGLFGEAIGLGEAAKERAFGDLLDHLGHVVGASRFAYAVAGDLELEGEAWSLVAANTPTTGADVPIGDVTPREPHLLLSARMEGSPPLALARLAAAGLLGRIEPGSGTRRFRRVRVVTAPPVPVFADAAAVGATPVEIAVEPGALSVLVPAGVSPTEARASG